ncbi:KH domain-containing protein [Drosera capensis]
MGDDSYSSLSSYSSMLCSSLTPTSMAEVMIPANAITKVLGKGGGNLENLCQLSGAMIDISETKNSRGDRVAYISGTSEQKRTAQNLIQAFIMET